jgi:hypothetical protein
MRRFSAVVCLVFTLAFVFGAVMPAPEAEAGPCYYKYICGFPHYGCINNGVEVCKREYLTPFGARRTSHANSCHKPWACNTL